MTKVGTGLQPKWNRTMKIKLVYKNKLWRTVELSDISEAACSGFLELGIGWSNHSKEKLRISNVGEKAFNSPDCLPPSVIDPPTGTALFWCITSQFWGSAERAYSDLQDQFLLTRIWGEKTIREEREPCSRSMDLRIGAVEVGNEGSHSAGLAKACCVVAPPARPRDGFRKWLNSKTCKTRNSKYCH